MSGDFCGNLGTLIFKQSVFASISLVSHVRTLARTAVALAVIGEIAR